MTNTKRQAIIDYLEQGERFAELLIKELERTDLEGYEKRTYSSLLDAINGSDELYCAMQEHEDNVIQFKQETKEKQEDAIVIEHGSDTLKLVKDVSDYIANMPLDKEINNDLIEVLKKLVLIAEHEAYMQGFIDCMDAINSGGFKGMEDKIVKVAELNI